MDVCYCILVFSFGIGTVSREGVIDCLQWAFGCLIYLHKCHVVQLADHIRIGKFAPIIVDGGAYIGGLNGRSHTWVVNPPHISWATQLPSTQIVLRLLVAHDSCYVYVQPPSLPDSTQIDHHLWFIITAGLNFFEKHHQEVAVQLRLISAVIRGGNFLVIIRSPNIIQRGKKAQVLPWVGALAGFSPEYWSCEHPWFQQVPLVHVHTHFISVQV